MLGGKNSEPVPQDRGYLRGASAGTYVKVFFVTLAVEISGDCFHVGARRQKIRILFQRGHLWNWISLSGEAKSPPEGTVQ